MLTPQQIMRAVAAELADQTKDQALPVGVHTFNARIVLEVQGSVDQGGDQLYTPTADIPLLAVLARFAEKAGVVGPRLLEMLQEAASEALEQGEPVGDSIEHTKAALKRVRDTVTSKLPKKTRKGALRRALRVDTVQFVPVQARSAG